MTRRTCGFARTCVVVAFVLAAAGLTTGSADAARGAGRAWRFASIPDFLNNDVPYPDPEWEDALGYTLDSIEAENPDFVLVAGDMVQGRWWESPDQVEFLADVHYNDWKQRFDAHGLKYYCAVGDHELGDLPAVVRRKKVHLVPHFKEAFRRHMDVPRNGPPGLKGLAYFFVHNDVLFVTVYTYRLDEENSDVQVTVSGRQVRWLDRVLKEHGDEVNHVIVQGHTPVLPGVKGRSSSRIMLEGGRKSAFWQTMARHGVDLYLAGEHHAVSRQHADGIEQIVHGSIFGYVDTVNYLVATVTPERIELEIKRLPIQNKGPRMYQEGGLNSPHDNVDISPEAREKGFRTVGTMVLDKSGGTKRFLRRTGEFKEAE